MVVVWISGVGMYCPHFVHHEKGHKDNIDKKVKANRNVLVWAYDSPVGTTTDPCKSVQLARFNHYARTPGCAKNFQSVSSLRALL